MIRLKNFALRNAVAFVALFVCLGGTATAAATLVDGANIKRGTITSEQVKERSLRGGDIAKGAVTQKTVKNETLLSQDIRDGHVLSRDVKNGGIREEDLSPELRATVTRGADGARGAQGEQGPAGDGAGETGSAGGFLVKDADGTTAGPLLNLADTANLTFYFKGHAFVANAFSGALALDRVAFIYGQTGCAGTKYASPNRPRQAAVRSAERSDAGVYAHGALLTLDVRSYWDDSEFEVNDRCVDDNFTTPAAAMHVLSAGDTPPALNGPLTYVSAG